MDDESPLARYRAHAFIADELYPQVCRTCGCRSIDMIHGADHFLIVPDFFVDMFAYIATYQPRRTHPMTVPFTMTQDSITVVLDGKVYTVQANTPQYHGLRDCIFREDWLAISKHVSMSGALQQWLGDKFVVDGETIAYEGALLPASISQRIWTMAAAGESPGPLFAFYERLAKNPSWRSVQQLWNFLAHAGIPLEPDGTFLAYKGVREDFLDQHSGKFYNEPGVLHRMPRNQISDDPSKLCHVGFHVGALEYARNFASRVVVCRVDPEHVVCVPEDHNGQKMRVCEYIVVGNWVGTEAEQMPSTTYTADVEETDDAEWGGDVEVDGEAKVVITSKPTAPKAATFARMNPGKLMTQSINDLRKYASAHLKIVGASKLPGGKSALVSKILKARKRRR